MKIGIPKEIKSSENRVALTPAGAHELVLREHEVFVEQSAGEGSSFSDEEYINAGAKILPSNKDVYNIADLIVKVKEPLEEEYALIKKNQILFTYFHFSSSETLTQAMIKTKAVCIAYETVETADHTLPLLIPMSEVAGRLSAQEGAYILEKKHGGKGLLMGGVTGTRRANVIILGGGIVGTQAAIISSGLGANVTVLDKNIARLRYLNEIMPSNITTMYSDPYTIHELVKTADVIIGSVLVVGDKAPRLITKDMLKDMKPGTVLVDVAIDQGGCFETSKPTTHENPTFIIDGVVHYCVANMPGAVPITSTMALTNATFPYVLKIANLGWEKACQDNLDLRKGLNIIKGDVVYEAVAKAHNILYTKY